MGKMLDMANFNKDEHTKVQLNEELKRLSATVASGNVSRRCWKDERSDQQLK